MSQARIILGRVRSVNPARREVRVTLWPGHASALAGAATVEFEPDDGKRRAFTVETVEEQNRCVKLTLAQDASDSDVAALRGAAVIGPAAQGAARDAFDMDAAEFEGFDVVDAQGNAVGAVAGGFNTPAHGVIEIDRGGGRMALAPFVPEVVADVEWEARRIVIRDVEAHIAEQDGGAMA
jgi:16S rRNA processing protein RimM